MRAQPRELRIFETATGRRPFAEWLDTLESRDEAGYEAILRRLERVEEGNFGDCRSLGHGLHEMKIDTGPGYRVYFGQDGDLVILLEGGPKKSQMRDIAAARQRWEEYNA